MLYNYITIHGAKHKITKLMFAFCNFVYIPENRRNIPYNDYTKQQLNQIYVLEVKLVLLDKEKGKRVFWGRCQKWF
jgi:hypothetical protein